MIRTVSQALDDAAAGSRGFTFVDVLGRDRDVPFAELRTAALAMAGALRARGLEPGDRVALAIPEAEGFITALLGASVAGLVPVPLAYPLQAAEHTAYLDKVASLVRVARARAIVTTPRLSTLLGAVSAMTPGFRFVATWQELEGPALAAPEPVDPHAPALLQFTSGSTSQPKGVVITHANLSANVHAIGGPQGIALGRGDVAVSWLPLFHDMGLIGSTMCPLYFGCRGVFLSPATFLRRPVEWLRAITRYRGTSSFAPNFAYEICVQRVREADFEGLDLSSWRVAGCGAEPIQAATLEAFGAKFARIGFRGTSFVAAYGLAEHTVAVALTPPGRGLRVDTVRSSELALHRRAVPCRDDDADASRVVACGRGFPGHAIRVVDERGRPVDSRVVGEIAVSGPSVMRGYLNEAGTAGEGLSDGWFLTGDLAYLADGELYVCGRRKETIIVSGRNYFPQDLERAVDGMPGVRPGKVAAFAATGPGRPDQAVVVVETLGAVPAGQIEAEVRRRVLQATGLAVHQIVLAPTGTIARTTSGKLRRTDLRERYVAGTLLTSDALAREKVLTT